MLSHKFISPIRVSLITNTIRRDSFSFTFLSLFLFLFLSFLLVKAYERCYQIMKLKNLIWKFYKFIAKK